MPDHGLDCIRNGRPVNFRNTTHKAGDESSGALHHPGKMSGKCQNSYCANSEKSTKTGLKRPALPLLRMLQFTATSHLHPTC